MLTVFQEVPAFRISLMGFDAGEQGTRHSAGSPREKHQDEIGSWLDLADSDYGYVPDRVRERIKAFNAQQSDATTRAAIAVVQPTVG